MSEQDVSTERPWEITYDGPSLPIISGTRGRREIVALVKTTEEDAALIVKAVNHYDELVEALEECIDILENTGAAWVDPMGYEETSTYTKARAILKKVRG